MMDLKLLEYNALDCCNTFEVHEHTKHTMQELGFQSTYDMTMRMFPVLTYMMTRGVRVDFDALTETKASVLVRIDKLQEELNELAGMPLNANSPKQLREYFYITKGAKAYTRQGKVTVDDKALQNLSKPTALRPAFKEASLIQQIRGLRKLHGTYLDILFDEDGRLRCSYNPRGTKFGRLSSSKTTTGTGMNMQNLPEEFMQFLVPDPGYFMCEVDKSQAEWVVVAYYSGDDQMIHVIENGLDPHAYTAFLMFDCPIELIQKESKLVGHTTDPETIFDIRRQYIPEVLDLPFITRTMSMRQAGKKSNHGLNYDEGPREFALQNEMAETEAKKVWNLYHAAYPGVHSMHNMVKEKLSRDRTLENCFGRRIKLMDGWGRTLWKSAYSAIPQSTVVDLINEGMMKMYEDRSDLMLPIEILMQVHDSIKFQYPIELIDQSPGMLAQVYEYLDPEMEYGGRAFHIGTDTKLGFNGRDLKELKFKPGETTSDDIRESLDVKTRTE